VKFKELAWGAFTYKNVNKGTQGTTIYNELVSDIEFLKRLQISPGLGDCERIRDFLVHFGVRFTPKDFAEKHLLPLWPHLQPSISLLAQRTIQTIDFTNPQIQDAIIHAFNWPFGVWGSDTVKSKVLHFFNVQLFVMWDEGISQPYKVGAEGYLSFLIKTQEEAKAVIADFNKLYPSYQLATYLSKKLGYPTTRPLTKLIDQYNWITIAKEWPAEPPDWLLEIYCKD